MVTRIFKISYFSERFHRPVVAWIILVISLCLTVTAYVVSRQLVEQRLHDQFQFRANEISHAIEDRLYVYEQVLWAGVAFFNASPEGDVNRQQWATFAEALRLDQHWLGIQGIGYSIPLTAEEKTEHIEGIRAEGFRDYQIKPEGERDEYTSIIYLEPFDWRNKRAFGFDMWSNPMRQAAMRRARDEGVAATSGIITLVQETSDNVQRGFLTYVPVYQGGKIPSTLAARQAAFQGWVYAPFRAGDLMQRILGSEDTDIVFEIYAGSEIQSDSLLYNSASDNQRQIDSPAFSSIQSITLQGRLWTLVFQTPADFIVGKESYIPNFVAVIGVIIDILLFYVILSLHYISRRARHLADDMTKELQQATNSLEEEVAIRTAELQENRDKLEVKIQQRTCELQSKVDELEKMNQLTTGRELRVIELKQQVNELTVALGRKPLYSIDNISNAE